MIVEDEVLIVEKKTFELSAFKFESGKTIPVQIGYETCGTLNVAKDNAILISHHFSATGHPCGVYSKEDDVPGFWDEMIGPGKSIDTDKYFIISADNLCNIQVKNQNVITTGPATINPQTGVPYGLDFPVTSTKDLANLQKILVESLGIRKLKAAMGPSLGGMIAMQLAVLYPEFVENLVGVVSSPQNPVGPSAQYLLKNAAKADMNYNCGDYYGKKEPTDALAVVAQALILSIYSPVYLEKLFPRDSKEEYPYLDINIETSYEKKLSQAAELIIKNADFNSWHFTTRITMNHDLARGYSSMEEALFRIQANVLLIANKQDCLEDWTFSKNMIDVLKSQNKNAKLYLLDDELGHMAGINTPHLFESEIKQLLEN